MTNEELTQALNDTLTAITNMTDRLDAAFTPVGKSLDAENVRAALSSSRKDIKAIADKIK